MSNIQQPEYLKFEALQFDMCDVLAATQFLSSNTLSRGGQILPGELYKVTLKSISGDKQVYLHIKIILKFIAIFIYRNLR